jgi:predicted flap endonuclease-1-like 5' DNA nuclease
MPPLTLVQKRALSAVAANLEKISRAASKVRRAYHSTMNRMGRPTQNTRRMEPEVAAMSRKWLEVADELARVERKLGLTDNDMHHEVRINIISNLMKKYRVVDLIREKMWRRGLEAEKKRALANFNEFSKGQFNTTTNHIAASHARKTPSPPRQRTPRRTSSPPANNAHRRIHGIGPANNTRVTWSRNANGKINRFRTLANLKVTLTNAQKDTLSNMSENQAMHTIRQLARST